ncbi:putative glutamate receptor 3.6-like [Capsicum annuum]|uniref:S-protein homolog n=1 Tax=Capsicum annuum TaxID=4072 RepID=A0A2G2ZGX4_CAPAN|nr:putative glutamate receptor 3.6-like [Capsicum annuum]KAF3679574.1 putative glutamate receptor 3.6-like [Capsicum annuum]PHT61170.1 hypothetical protein T459_34980 [Capsicum annuum]PHT81243.1 hypothetical protein T459_14258 [Capsicum annuum]
MALPLVNIFFILLLITSLDLSLGLKCLFSEKFEVHVINKLPPGSPQLKLHCASKDNDLGYHDPTIDGDFNWSFCSALFGRTLYFCHFWWNSKDKAFDVFNSEFYCVKDQKVVNYLRYCKWEVRSDGFYLEQYNNETKAYYMTHYLSWP